MYALLRPSRSGSGAGLHQVVSDGMPALRHEGRHAATREHTRDTTTAARGTERRWGLRSADHWRDVGRLHPARRDESREIQRVAEEPSHSPQLHALEKLVQTDWT